MTIGNIIFAIYITVLIAFYIKKWIFVESTMSAAPDSASHKRFIAVQIFFCVCLSFMYAFLNDIEVKDTLKSMWETLVWAGGALAGVTAITDAYSKKGKGDDSTNNPQQ